MRVIDLIRDIADTTARLHARGPYFTDEVIARVALHTLMRPDFTRFALASMGEGMSSREQLMGLVLRMAEIVHYRVPEKMFLTTWRNEAYAPMPTAHLDAGSRHMTAIEAHVGGGVEHGDFGQFLLGGYGAFNFIGLVHEDHGASEAKLDALFTHPNYVDAGKLIIAPTRSIDSRAHFWADNPKTLFADVLLHGRTNPMSCVYISRATTAAEAAY